MVELGVCDAQEVWHAAVHRVTKNWTFEKWKFKKRTQNSRSQKTIKDMKNEYDGLIGTLDTAEERISVPDVLFVETSKTEKHREKRKKEMQIKTTMRYHLTPGRMAIIKKSTGASLVVQWLRLHAPLLTKKKKKKKKKPSCSQCRGPRCHPWSGN